MSCDLTGANAGMDHVELQALAQLIYALDSFPQS